MGFGWQERHTISGDQVTADELKLFTENDQLLPKKYQKK